MAKFIKYGNQIFSLENVREVELISSESTHTSYGKKYTIKHYTNIIKYFDNSSSHIKTPDDDPIAAKCLFHAIFGELTAD